MRERTNEDKLRILQERLAQIQEKKQSEQTKFYPKSPYASSKLFAYWIMIHKRRARGFMAQT